MTPIPQGSLCKENLCAQFSGVVPASEGLRQSTLRHVDVGEFVDGLKATGVSCRSNNRRRSRNGR